MEDEFGLDVYMDINCKFTFTTSMELLMPNDRTIEVSKYGEDFVFNVNGGFAYISEDMIEKIVLEEVPHPRDYTLDELYGVDLNMYLIRHGKSRRDLIHEIEVDIMLLNENRKRIASTEPRDIELYPKVEELLLKKRKHLKRIQAFN